MHIKKDDVPLVAFPHDELWVVFRDQPIDAVLWLSSVTGAADVELESGVTQEPSLLTGFATVNLTYKNARVLTDLVAADIHPGKDHSGEDQDKNRVI